MTDNSQLYAYATFFTARSIAIEMLKDTDVRSEMISAEDLIKLQTEMVLLAITIMLLGDVDTDDIWKEYFEVQDLIETLTH